MTNVPTPPSPFIVMCFGTCLWPVWVSCPGCVPSQSCAPVSWRGGFAEAALGTSTAQHVGLGENQPQLLQRQAGVSACSLELQVSLEYLLRGVMSTAGRVWLCVHPWCLNFLPAGRMLLNDSKKGPPHLHYRRPYGCAVLSIMDVLQSISEIKEEKDFVLKVYTWVTPRRKFFASLLFQQLIETNEYCPQMFQVCEMLQKLLNIAQICVTCKAALLLMWII